MSDFPKKNSLAIAYSVQKKNKKRGKLASAETEKKATADDQAMFAAGGTVRAGSERPTADAHQCTVECQDMTVRDHEMLRAGSGRATADSMQGNPAGTAPSTGGTNVRAGSSRPTADKDESTNAKFAMGGDVEDEDTSSHMGTLAESIARRVAKHMMAEGGDVRDEDTDSDSIEHGNYADDLNFDALGKELYDEDQLSDQPKDSNETGDSEESDDEDKEDKSIISKIRARSKSKKD